MIREMDKLDICIGSIFANMFFFFFSMAQASLLPFISLYLLYVGLNPLETGIIISCKLFASAISSIFWVRCCSANDGRRKCMLIMSIFIMAISHLVMVLMPIMDLQVASTFCPLPCITNCSNLSANNFNQPFFLTTKKIFKNITFESNLLMQDFGLHSISIMPITENNTTILSINKSELGKTKEILNFELVTLTNYNLTSIKTSKKAKKSSIDLVANTSVLNIYNTKKIITESLPILSKKYVNFTKELSTSSITTSDFSNNLTFYDVEPIDNAKEALLGDDDVQDSNYYNEHKRDSNILLTVTNIELLSNQKNSKMKSDDLYIYNKQDVKEHIRTLNERSNNDKNIKYNYVHDGNEKSYLESLLSSQLSDIRHQIFATMLVIVLTGDILSSPTRMLADESWVRFTEGREPLGDLKQGWVFVGSSFGALLVVITIENLSCYPAIYLGFQRIVTHFFLFLLLNFISFFISFCFPTPLRDQSDYRDSFQQSRILGSIGRGLRLVFRDARTCLNTFSVIVVGFVQGFIFIFLPWVIYKSYGNKMPSELPLGIAIFLAFLSEFISLFMMSRFCSFIGHVISITLGLLILTMRCVLYSFELAGIPWLALLGEGSALFSICLIRSSINLQSPFKLDLPLIDTSPRACLNIFYNAIGLPLGCLSASLSLHYLNSLAITFQIGAAVSAVWCGIFLLTYPFCGLKTEHGGHVGQYKRLKNGDIQMHSIDEDDEESSGDAYNDVGSEEEENRWMKKAFKHNV